MANKIIIGIVILIIGVFGYFVVNQRNESEQMVDNKYYENFKQKRELRRDKEEFANESQVSEMIIENDIQYDDCTTCKLDVYNKDDDIEDKPIVIFVHGGGWKMGSKSLHSDKGEFFSQKDNLFISVDYPLFPDADYKEQARMIASAVNWAHQNAQEYGGDKNNIILLGHSAGAHLIALISTNETYLQSVGLGLTNIKETILLDSGGLDIVELRETTPALFKIVHEPVFGSKVKDLQEASPNNYIEKDKNTPSFLIFHSTLNEGRALNSINFDKKLKINNIESEIHGIEATHEEINKNIGSKDDEITKIIMEHINN